MATRTYNAIRRKGAPRLPIGRRSILRGDTPRRAARPEPHVESPPEPPATSDREIAGGESATPVLNLQSERTISVKEAAFRLGKSEDAVRLWLRQGRLKGWQPGGRGCAILVAEASLEKALACVVR